MKEVETQLLNNKLYLITKEILTSTLHKSNNGLLSGKMGIAIFLFHYARYSHDEQIEEDAFDLVSQIIENLDISLIDYKTGLSGIGVGIEYLIQQSFLEGNSDEVFEDFDEILSTQICSQKLYLSTHNLLDLERYFQMRLSNPKTEKQFFLQEILQEIDRVKQLHIRVDPLAVNKAPRIGGISGNAGLGLSLLSIIEKQHTTWIQLI